MGVAMGIPRLEGFLVFHFFHLPDLARYHMVPTPGLHPAIMASYLTTKHIPQPTKNTLHDSSCKKTTV